MPKKNILSIFTIEYLLLFIAAGIFSSTIIFKSMAEKKMTELDHVIIELQETKNPDALNKVKELCFSFTHFDRELKTKLNEIDTGTDSFEITVAKFQNELHKKQRTVFFGYDSYLYSSIILIIIAVIEMLIKRLSQKNEYNRIKTIEEEQKKFSRNLHDGVAQDLAAIRLCQSNGDTENLSFYTERALSEVRYLIDSSRYEIDDDIETNIKTMLSIFETNYEIETKFLSTSSFISRLKKEDEIELLYIIQEALSNISRHANATKVKITITDVKDELRILIIDNGKGFSQEKPLEDEQNHKHWGIKNIRDRVQLLGGTVDFINNGGTTIAIRIKNPVSR